MFSTSGFPGNKCVEYNVQFTELGSLTRDSLPTLAHYIIAKKENVKQKHENLRGQESSVIPRLMFNSFLIYCYNDTHTIEFSTSHSGSLFFLCIRLQDVRWKSQIGTSFIVAPYAVSAILVAARRIFKRCWVNAQGLLVLYSSWFQVFCCKIKVHVTTLYKRLCNVV